MFRQDPGECIVCGAQHCACGGGEIQIPQLPNRDAAAAAERSRPVLKADEIQATLPPGQFTSGTYRRPKKGAQ